MKYDYEFFGRRILERDGLDCWLRAFLVDKQRKHPHDYSPGLLVCNGQIDAHHFLRKNRIRQQLNDDQLKTALEDPRNGCLVCRRHHDLLERGLVVLRYVDLPERVHEFAADYNLSGWLTRYYMRDAA